MNLLTFKAKIDVIGINPFVFLPENILETIFIQAGKNKAKIPVKGFINGVPYRQTLLRYSGVWRLYISTKMLEKSPKRIGETIEINIEFDPESRAIKMPADFKKALLNNSDAQAIFDELSPSKQNEIVKYLVRLKTPTARERNIVRAIQFLLGEARFIGRDKP
ncbi:YdeI/OmpD-associated family protein [Lacinutrix chionoecetis]